MGEMWMQFGMWTVVVVWGGLALAVLLPITARRIVPVLSNARTRPIGTVLCLMMLGFAIAYGGSKPAPVEPTDPDTPVVPTDPTDPSNPDDPSTPSGPSDPTDPSSPDDPSTPSDPSDPTDPSSPDDPSTPSDPSDPTGPSSSDDPSTPSGPSDPTAPSNPDDPVAEETHVLYESVVGLAPAVASVYDGYLVDDNGAIRGTIQVKVGKPNKNTKQAAVKATVVIGTKKTSLKAAGGKAEIKSDGPTAVTLSGGAACEIVLGTYALSGEYGPYMIDGARNLFSSKDKLESKSANQVIAQYKAPTVVVWDGGNASVSIASKGKVKASVMLANGTKANVKSQFLIGEEWCCVPIFVAKKVELAFAVWFSRNGGQFAVSGIGESAVAGRSGGLQPDAAFHIDKNDALWSQVSEKVLTDYLPDNLPVAQNGKKWVVAKAGKVVYVKGTTEVDETKLGKNPSALKLKYNSKDGSFSGSFKIYSASGSKLKATTVNVMGVVVGSVARGTATIKNVAGAVPVTIK